MEQLQERVFTMARKAWVDRTAEVLANTDWHSSVDLIKEAAKRLISILIKDPHMMQLLQHTMPMGVAKDCRENYELHLRKLVDCVNDISLVKISIPDDIDDMTFASIILEVNEAIDDME
jgi:hypothetical protein